VGQSLAKLELQAMLATIVGRFVLSPGADLQKKLAAAAPATAAAGDEVDGDGELYGAAFNPADVLRDCIMYHVTLQPKGGMLLQFAPRARYQG
jgi:hypothetical protein